MPMYNACMSRWSVRNLAALVVFVLLPAGLQLACSRSRDVSKDLKIVDARTGWYDAGIVDGKNKIVPSIAFTLAERLAGGDRARAGERDLPSHQRDRSRGVNTSRRRSAPKGCSRVRPATNWCLRGNLGYTSPDQSRAQILADRRFVDVKVEVFGKHGSRTWVKMGEFPIERKLLTATRPK